ncbi:MAG: methyltransferase domain-containing protein [Bacteroidetes bacterium]|nr:methyltransferase domain-containing protein [Bacteroidota bacterium]
MHHLFQKVFHQIKLKKRRIEDVLVLGFGVGSVAGILQNELKINCKITGVEYSNEVIQLGYDLFKVDRFKNLEIINNDAFDFVQNHTSKYDLIVIDIFEDATIPPKFFGEEFLNKLPALTTEKGMVVFNIIVNTHADEERFNIAKDFFTAHGGKVQVIEKLFSNRVLCWERI